MGPPWLVTLLVIAFRLAACIYKEEITAPPNECCYIPLFSKFKDFQDLGWYSLNSVVLQFVLLDDLNIRVLNLEYLETIMITSRIR